MYICIYRYIYIYIYIYTPPKGREGSRRHFALPFLQGWNKQPATSLQQFVAVVMFVLLVSISCLPYYYIHDVVVLQFLLFFVFVYATSWQALFPAMEQ